MSASTIYWPDLAAIERIVRHLRPDVLVPAERVAEGADVGWWQSYYTRAAATAIRASSSSDMVSTTMPSAPASAIAAACSA